MVAMHRRSNLLWAKSFVVLLLLCAFPEGVVNAQVKPVRRVLIIYEVNPTFPGINIIDAGVRAALDNSPYKLEIYRAYLDTIYFPDEADQQEIRAFYIHKYQNRRPDVIITVGPSSLKFMSEMHQAAFPGVPMVFCLPHWVPGPLALDHDFTGVENDQAALETVKAAVHLQRGTKHVVVVGGAAFIDTQIEDVVKKQLNLLNDDLDISYLTSLTMPDLLERLKRLPKQTIVLFTSFSRDAAGTKFISGAEAGPMVVAAANAPVFGLSDVNIDHGEVGGKLSSVREQGRIAGDLALRILGGEKPQGIPWINAGTTYIFDSRSLKRWGFSERDLPTGSTVLNRQPTVWELYKWYITAGVCLLLVQTSLIVGLLWQWAIRRKAEAELTLTYDRLRLAVEAGKAVSWDSDPQSNRLRWYGDLRTMFGIPSDTFDGQVGDFYRHVHPDDRELVRSIVAGARSSHGSYAAEFRVIRNDQAVRWVTAKGKFYYKNDGKAEQMVGMAFDITDRKLAEQQVRESEDRLAGIIGTAMDAMIAIDAEQRIVLFNPAAEKMFGCLGEEAVGTTIDRFIPERFRRKHTEYIQTFRRSGVTARLMSSRGVLWALRTNGEEFPIEASISHTESDGKKMFTVIIRDISERLRAEEALSSIGRRLIEAHEEERTWIGRELHDDINQRLAILAIEMDAWKQEVSRDKLSEHLSHAKQRIMDLSMDVQALSHRLHSSKLEYLGLAVAAGSFCKEVSEKAKVDVQFSHSAVPSTMPKEVSLCLFRVLQEALQNAIKYSGVSRFHVNLRRMSDGLELTVADEGKGFVEQAGFSSHGLGLISMRERLQIVDGELEIKTQLGAGTTIIARVPLQTAELRAIAG